MAGLAKTSKELLALYHKQDLDAIETHAPNNTVCKRAVIVGGGLIGIELAEMFHSRHIPVTFLVRENSYWSGILPSGESEMINNEIRKNGIDLRLRIEFKTNKCKCRWHCKVDCDYRNGRRN